MENNNNFIELQSNSKRARVDLVNLSLDPCLKKYIFDYHSNDRDKIRRAYVQKGPFQPIN